MTTTQSTQTDTDTLPAEMPSTLQQLKAELREVQAELRSKDESLAAALILRTELLTAAHDSVLKHALDAELVQAQTIRWSEQLGQAQSGAAAERQLRTQLGQEIEGVRLELTQLQAQHSELQSQHACLKTKAESLQALEATHKADLQCMTQRAEAAQDHASLSKASTLAIAQQFDQLQARSSLLEQTQEDLKALILEAAQHVRGGAELVKITNVDGSILSAAKALIECMQLQTEEAEAATVTLTKQLQEAEGAHALQVEQLRYGPTELAWSSCIAYGLPQESAFIHDCESFHDLDLQLLLSLYQFCSHCLRHTSTVQAIL